LSDEECDHIISLAKESGLQTSTSGFFSNYEADLDAVLEIAGEDALKIQLVFNLSFPSFKFVSIRINMKFW